MSNSDISDEDKIPKSPFAVYRTEADALFRGAKYVKAIKCYTQALELQPGHEHCLVARSRCYLFEGQIDKALADAESSLENNSKNPKGLFQKAEVYYFQSEFEKALVLYHRGHKLRPEMEAFRLGIQKSEEAINNSVGNPEAIKLRLDCDLSYFFLNDENKSRKKKTDRIIKKKPAQEKKTRLERKPCNTDSRTVKQLLGELYSDREFLEKLLNEEESLVNKTENSEQIRHLVVKGLNYLDERSDFWQQQKPMYARKKFQIKRSKTGSKQQRDIIKYVVTALDEIDSKQSRGEHRKAIRQSENLIKQIDKWLESELPDRLDILANLYCLIGNSYLDLEEFDKALEYHEKDKDHGKSYNNEESLSRAIDNIGRVYAKQKQYDKAIEIWNEKIAMSKSALESTWLHHEMGRCYLELEEYEKAIEYGEKSIEFAREAEDDKWQMNANILVAQGAFKCKKYSLSVEHFDRALDYSKMMKNAGAEDAIKKAIEDVNQKIIDEDKENRVTSESKEKPLAIENKEKAPIVETAPKSLKEDKIKAPEKEERTNLKEEENKKELRTETRDQSEKEMSTTLYESEVSGRKSTPIAEPTTIVSPKESKIKEESHSETVENMDHITERNRDTSIKDNIETIESSHEAEEIPFESEPNILNSPDNSDFVKSNNFHEESTLLNQDE